MDDNKRTWTREQKRAFWREHIEAWKLGTLTQKAYCVEHKLSRKTFHHWRTYFKYEDEVIERRARKGRKTKIVLRSPTPTRDTTLLAERVRVLRARLATPIAVRDGSESGASSRISSAR